MKKYIKKCYFYIVILVFAIALSGCGKKKEPPVIADGEFIKISTKQVGDVDELKDYTIYITLNTNGKLTISAGDFKHWYGEEACPVVTTDIPKEKVEEIKQLVFDCNFFNMNEDVGNRDMTSGEERSITVTTTDKVYSSHGLNVANRSFIKLFEAVYSLKREEFFSYIETVNRLQDKGKEITDYRGIIIYDEMQKEIIGNKDVIKIDKTKAVNVLMLNTDSISEEDKIDEKYYVYMEIDSYVNSELGKKYGDTGENTKFLLYVDDEFAYNLYVNYALDGRLYIDRRFTKEEANEVINMLKSKQLNSNKK
ncbi:MAG: hypothetical protein PUG10_02745 [Lachnospiraceae bacterium]|nr:hypothetical protein [Lachnospiraceae bacterium]